MTSAIVVGGGSAGSVVARRLVDAGVEVTLLEAGGEDTNPAIHDPMRMAELWHSADDWDYYTVPQAAAANRRLHLPRGKVLGGSHALNAMIWVRCAPQDFDGWAAEGNDGWSWADVLPVYKTIEDYSGGASGVARGGWPASGDRELPAVADPGIHHRSRRAGRTRAQSGLQRRPPRRRLARAGDDARRPSREHLDGIPQAGARAADDPHGMPRAFGPRRERSRGRRPLP